MTCCQCQGIEKQFNRGVARRDLERYRKKGPAQTTRLLIDALKAEGVDGKTLLDIGGGIGALQHELMKTGISQAVSVEASTAYLEASREEAQKQGYAERARYHHGDFVDLVQDIPPADIVTLDRVICCYHDAQALLDQSTARARNLYGVIYPRDRWWTKLIGAGINAVSQVRRNPFRFFVHPTAAVEATIRARGLRQRFYRKTLLWQVAVYGR